MQDTSRLAYRQIQKEGITTNQKQVILNCVKNHDRGLGMSLREIQSITGIEINAVSGRVNDLKKANLLSHPMWKRACKISGRKINPVIIAIQPTI